MTRYAIVPARSSLSALARSNVHPIHGEARELTGWVEAIVADGAVDAGQPASAYVEFPIDNLQADNALVNREIQRRLGSRRYPTVRAEINEVSAGEAGRVGVRGKLSLAGTTQEVSGTAAVEVGTDGTMTVDGELTLDLRDFGLDPPKMLGLRVYPDVTVRLTVHAVAET